MMVLRRLLNPRRWPSPVVFTVVLIAVLLFSGLIASLGILLAGSRDAFERATQAALPWLMLWRFLCYAGGIAAWLRLWKPRVIKRLNEDQDGGAEARQRLRRLETLSIVALVCIELYNLIDWLGN